MSSVSFAVRWGNAILSLLILAAAPALAQTTPAGTTLTSTAEVAYYDGVPQTVSAAPVTLTVAGKAAASVHLPVTSGTVSGTQAFGCTLSNTGNSSTGINISLSMSMSAYAYLTADVNEDGVWQKSENTILRSLPAMQPGESVNCFLVVRARSQSYVGSTGTVTVIAAPTAAPDNQASADFTATFVSPKLHPSFTYQMSGPVSASPTISNGVALVGSEEGVLYAVYAQGDAAGTLAWRYPATGTLGAPIRSRVAADETSYYVAADDGTLHCVDLAGNPVWQSQVAPVGTRIKSMPIVANDSITLACGDGRVRRVDALTGAVVGVSHPVGQGVLSTPSLPNSGDLWVGGADGYLYNMKANDTFTILSAHPISARAMSATPFVDTRSGMVISVGEEGSVYAMRIRSDVVVWGPKSLGSPVKGSPYVDAGTGIAYFVTEDGSLHALRVTDGGPVAGYPVRLTEVGGFAGSPVVLPLPKGLTTVFAASTSGSLHAVNAAVPTRASRFDTGDTAASFLGTPALSGPTLDAVIVAVTVNGTMYGFSVEDALALQ